MKGKLPLEKRFVLKADESHLWGVYDNKTEAWALPANVNRSRAETETALRYMLLGARWYGK